ncbi:SHOCT domain-containing protein, partial [Thiocapsa sp. N5-Cardenillas]
APVSIADGLARLAALHREGVLTPEELARLKRQITERSSGVEDVIRLLRGLKALEREGVLTEGEFNIKKWDILSGRLLRKD